MFEIIIFFLDLIVYDTQNQFTNSLPAIGNKQSCDCLDSNCYICVPENVRKIIFRLYNSYPLIDSPRKMYAAIAHFTKVPLTLVSRLFKLHHQVLNPANKRKPKPPFRCNKPIAKRLLNFELCYIKCQLLSSKPKQFITQLQQICINYKNKIKSTDLVRSIFSSKTLSLCHVRHKISKNAYLILSEERSLRVRRLEFIQQMQNVRTNGKRIIYIHELLLDEKDKNKRILIAACSDGPMSTTYMQHATMKASISWLKKRILTAINEPSVFVFNESSIFYSENVPIMNDSKATMKNWLKIRKINFDDNLLRIELYDLIQMEVSQTKSLQYLVDRDLTEKGHEILHIPNESCDLDPLAYIFLNIKFKATAKGSTAFDLNKELQSIPNERWREHFNRIIDAEQNYMTIEKNFDLILKYYHIDNDEYTLDNSIYTNDVTRR